MAGGEKKGLFGKLFGRKDKTEEPKREKRQTRPPRTPARQGKKDAQKTTPSKAAEESPEKEAKKSDAVELELDIPENEISTVALSVADLDVSLLPEEPAVEAPSPSAKPPVSPGTLVNGSESETIDETTEIKLDAAHLRAVGKGAAAVDDSAPGIPADKEPTRPLDNRRVPVKEVRTDLSAKDDDDFEIELDVGKERQRVAVPEEPASTPVGSLTTQAEPEPSSTQAEPEPSPVTEEEAYAVTSGRVAMQYGFPEYVADEEAVAEEAAVPGLLGAAQAEPGKPEPRVGPSAIADTPLAGQRLSTMTPAMIARAEALAEVIETCQTPMHIQVHGDAGSGKTSLLHAVGARLTERVIPLWLSARDFVGFEWPARVSWLFLEDFLASLEKRVSAADDDFVKSAQQAKRHLRLAAQAEAWPTESETESSGQQQLNRSPDAPTVSELRSELSGLVDRGLELAAADKLCVFLDDVHRLDGGTAVEIMETAYRFLALENCVIVAVCDSEALSRGAVERCQAEAVDEGIPYLERIFQLSVNVPLDHGAMGQRLQGLLGTIHFPCSEEDLEDYLRLQRYSIGPNPRREKLVANRLMLLSKLWPDVCGPEDGDPATALNRKLLFGLVCLDMAFPRVFRLLLSVLPQERDLALLLQETLRARGEVLALDQDLSLFPRDSDREDRSQRLIAFLDSLVDILLNGDHNRRVDAQSTHTLSNLLRLVDAVGPSTAVDWCEDDPRGAALTEFCRRVVAHLQRSLGKGAPDVLDRRIRIQSSGNAWFSLRYSAENNAKAVWGPGRLFYELSFSPENVASVALKCDTVRAAELGVPSETIKGLNRLPVVQQGRFRFKDYGTGWVEIVTVLHACSCHSASDPVDHEVESVAAALQDLVIGTRDVFDVPHEDVTPVAEAPEQPQVLCKVCKNRLEPVTLKDGSQAYKCGTCRKIYKAKPLSKPAK